MGYSGKIDVMIDFIEFESFWFDPTVHDISNNLYGFSKFNFSIILQWIPLQLYWWHVVDSIRHQFQCNLKIHFENIQSWLKLSILE